jgi:hypothetical protein
MNFVRRPELVPLVGEMTNFSKSFVSWLEIILFSIALFLTLDITYSLFVAGDARPLRIRVDQYHHGLAKNYSGYDVWGGRRYEVFTNNLGMKDEKVREVAPHYTSHRILLIGDSFTEAIGLPFDESFSGMLYRAGQNAVPKIEFLNAGVASYSPAIYYKRIQGLIAEGIRFDEVVIFSDPSDVQDEATSYFCIDDDLRYQRYCDPQDTLPRWARKKSFLETYLTVTNAIGMGLKRLLLSLPSSSAENYDVARIGWLRPDPNVDRTYAPLGVDGGVARSLKNMGALAELLKAHNILMTIVVYPWISQIIENNRNSAQISLWGDFCRQRCRNFVDLYPVFFHAAESDPKWKQNLFIAGDIHFSEYGNELIYQELARTLIPK